MNTAETPAETAAMNRYFAALHAMQSGVALKMNHEPDEATPKHLWVGINSAMAEHAAVVSLLLAAGLFTREQYYLALAEHMEAERDKYQAWANKRYGDGSDGGPTVTLG